MGTLALAFAPDLIQPVDGLHGLRRFQGQLGEPLGRSGV